MLPRASRIPAAFRTIALVPETKLAEHLRRYPLFSKLPEAELTVLAERMRTRSFKRGESLFRKDDPGTHLYVILDGAVKIALPGEFGQEALVAIMRPVLATAVTCAELIENSHKILERQWFQQGSSTVRIELPPAGGRDLLVRASEEGVDIEVEIRDRNGATIARADSPVERHTSQHAYLTGTGNSPVTIMYSVAPNA